MVKVHTALQNLTFLHEWELQVRLLFHSLGVTRAKGHLCIKVYIIFCCRKKNSGFKWRLQRKWRNPRIHQWKDLLSYYSHWNSKCLHKDRYSKMLLKMCHNFFLLAWSLFYYRVWLFGLSPLVHGNHPLNPSMILKICVSESFLEKPFRSLVEWIHI